MLVPGEALRRASASINAVTLCEMFGLMSSSRMAMTLGPMPQACRQAPAPGRGITVSLKRAMSPAVANQHCAWWRWMCSIGAAQMFHAKRLADHHGMQRDAHAQGLVARLQQQFVELVDHHVGKLGRSHLAPHDRGTVVDLLG